MRRLGIFWILLSILMMGKAAAVAQVDSRQELISVVYRNVKLIVNGRLISTPVEPFQVDGGHLMVPIRVLAEALGQEVSWDPDTKAVYIGKSTPQHEIGDSGPVPVYVEEVPVLRNVGPFFRLESRNITIASRQFNHGLVVELAAPPSSNVKKTEDNPGHFAETVVDLRGQYSWVEGYLGVDDETRNSWGGYKLHIYGDGLPLYESRVIKPSEYPFQIRVQVQNVKRLSLQAHWVDEGIGDYDRVWAALANLQVY